MVAEAGDGADLVAHEALVEADGIDQSALQRVDADELVQGAARKEVFLPIKP